ncbi:MAG: class IV adenylate cyclase [Sedimentisphaerales bacterium]|jgi:adenylate cyclase class 2|nr:class IV adenylate cyclase [Sedimentisphaerales bacterium]
MALEIETKLKIDSLEPLRQRLILANAQFVGDVVQQDDYYDDTLHRMLKSDRCLRVRKESDSRGDMTILFYKGPKHPSKMKVRDELKVAVSDGQALAEILTALGYKKALTVHKKRGMWQMDGCIVCLDEVQGLGSFVEIEGPDEQAILDVQRSLGLEGLAHIGKGYAAMLAAKAKAGD